jgi:SAM-dependent methyltransferase
MMRTETKTPPDAALPHEPDPVDYVERWRRLVDRRRVQMETANRAAGIDATDYWGRRAKTYREALHARMHEDAFFLRLRGVVTATDSVIDAGAGTGRHTLALAPLVRRVTAVDPSEAMLGLLRDALQEEGIANVDTVLSGWMEAEVAPADYVICSHVLYPIADVVPFVRKLEGAARRRVYIYLRADPLPTDLGLWGEFHGEALTRQPTHHDLFNVLWQEGIFCDVEVVNQRFAMPYPSLDAAVSQVRHTLALREGDTAAEAKLRGLLETRLSKREDGQLVGEYPATRSAILSWVPGGGG